MRDEDSPPLYSSGVAAGFPSPADDHLEANLDIGALLVKRPSSTFHVRASGDSMTPGILDGDILVVDRSIVPTAGDIVVAVVDGGLTVKRLTKAGTGWVLASTNGAFADIPIDDEVGIHIWGVVTWSVTAHCPR